MEGLDIVKSLVKRGDYMLSLDLNQAFYHVPLARNQRQYFAFDFLNKRYCFTCLPFGLTTSPRVFTKILKPLIGLLRQQGMRIVTYLDNILIMAILKKEVLDQTSHLISALQNHGFTINIKKSCLNPTQVIDYLGFQVNTKEMIFKLPRHKIKNLTRECRKVKSQITIHVRKLASLIGKIITITNAVFSAHLYSRALLRDKNYGLK